MVELLLRELQRPDGIPAVEVFHVNSRVSDDIGDVGRAGMRKLWRLLGYCGRALQLRWRHGADMIFYYVPAPGQRAALLRDWIVMALCRPWFRWTVWHWHGSGLGAWLQRAATAPERALSMWLLGRPDLSVVLARSSIADQAIFRPRRVAVIPNGIPDPCPDFDAGLQAERVARAAARLEAFRGGGAAAAPVFRVLFLAHCTREKGLFDALDAVVLLARELHEKNETPPVRIQFTVAGNFLNETERAEFSRAATEVSDLLSIACVGFAAGRMKADLLRSSDCFCFPTYYPREVQPVALIEALAFGMPIVTTRWRAIPEMLPPADGGAAGCWLAAPNHPAEVAAGLRAALLAPPEIGGGLRAHFLQHFRISAFGQRMREEFCSFVDGRN